MALEGIDVSRWNAEPINYSGLSFVFVQITHGLSPEPLAAEHIAAARKAGVAVMAYHYMEPGSSGVAQAQFCAAEAKKLNIEMRPLALDAEVANIGALVRPFILEAKKTFPSVGLYSYLSWIKAVGGGYMGADWGWVAYPGAFTLPQGWTLAKTKFWQYGEKDGLDRDKFLGTQAEFDEFHHPKAPPVVVPPKVLTPRQRLLRRLRRIRVRLHQRLSPQRRRRLRLMYRRILRGLKRS